MTETGPTLRLQSVDMIWDRGPHQAFTDLIRYQDQWVCAFREADRHDGGIEGSKLIILSSADGKKWGLAHEIQDPRGDVRDAKLSINPRGELVLLSAIQRFGATSVDDRRHQSFVVTTSDLESWSDPVDVTDDGYWLWGLSWNPGDGYGYSIGYRADYTAHLYRTRDGRSFERVAESIDAVTNKPNESAIVFDGDSAFCLLRAFGPAYIGTARSPFTDWSWKQLDQPIGGPEMIRLPDGKLLGAGRFYLPDKVRVTAIFTVDPHRGAIHELLRLPSGGDTSYPGMVLHDGKLYMSYYASHEGKSKVYFATIDFVGDGGRSSLAPAGHAPPEAVTEHRYTDPESGAVNPYLLFEPLPEAGTEPVSLLIYLHGAGGSLRNYNLMREPYARLRDELAARGYYVVVPGLGGQHFMNDAAKRALDGIVDQVLAERSIPSDRVHVMGTSMGGGSSLAYAIHRPDLISSVCAVMPMTDFAAWVAENPKYAGRVAEAYGETPGPTSHIYAGNSAIRNIDAFTDIPVMLIHGSEDRTVLPAHSERLAAALLARGYPCELHLVDGFAHQDAVVESLQLDIADFFDRAAGDSVSAGTNRLHSAGGATFGLHGRELGR